MLGTARDFESRSNANGPGDSGKGKTMFSTCKTHGIAWAGENCHIIHEIHDTMNIFKSNQKRDRIFIITFLLNTI